jgi:hypothetical protein
MMIFLKLYWKQIIGSMFILIIYAFGALSWKSYWQSPLIEKIGQYEIAQKKYNDMIDGISNKTKEDVISYEAKIKDANSKIDELSSDYQKLKASKQKNVFIVKDPRNGKNDLPIEFNGKGDQICTRFSDTYLETLNAMIKEANK